MVNCDLKILKGRILPVNLKAINGAYFQVHGGMALHCRLSIRWQPVAAAAVSVIRSTVPVAQARASVTVLKQPCRTLALAKERLSQPSFDLKKKAVEQNTGMRVHICLFYFVDVPVSLS